MRVFFRVEGATLQLVVGDLFFAVFHAENHGVVGGEIEAVAVVILAEDRIVFAAHFMRAQTALRDQNGFGLGQDHSGVLVYLDMNIRMMVIITSGQAMTDIPDENVDTILEAAMPFLQKGDYCGAVMLALNMADEYIED